MLILLAGADSELSRCVGAWLRSIGHRVDPVRDGKSAVDQSRLFVPDLLIAAADLPGISGLEVCREVRLSSNLPIILLGNDHDIDGCVAGLDAGADDYLAPPIQRREFLARVGAIARRAGPAEEHEFLKVGDLRIYLRQFRVTVRDVDLAVRPQEYRLLLVLAREPGVVFSSKRLLELAWNRPVGISTVGVHVSWLRHKLRRSSVRLENVRGNGFRLVVREPVSLSEAPPRPALL